MPMPPKPITKIFEFLNVCFKFKTIPVPVGIAHQNNMLVENLEI